MAKPSWVTCSPSSGTGSKSVNVTASKSTSSSTRSGSFTVKTSSGLTKSVSVSQRSNTYNISVTGSLFIKNQQAGQTLDRVDVSIGFYNVDGDKTGPYDAGAAYNLPEGTTEVADLEYYGTFQYMSDQEPFDRFGWIQLSCKGNKSLKGTIGTIDIQTSVDGGTISGYYDLGKIEESNIKIQIGISGSYPFIDFNNSINNPIIINEFY